MREQYPLESLKSLRLNLFEDACKAVLIPPESQGFPLVNRRDTALRPASTVLCEDIWTIVMCITNKTCLPRILKMEREVKTF